MKLRSQRKLGARSWTWLLVAFLGAAYSQWGGAFSQWSQAAPVGRVAPVIQTFSARVAGRSASGVKVRLDSVRLRVGLGQGLVGRTESLAGIARRYGALAAINGGFFAAYDRTPVKNPAHTIATGGQVAHLGNIGTVLYFTDAGAAYMERVPLAIIGSMDGDETWGHRWYAYWLNRLPGPAPTITIFTSAWGSATGLNDGTQATVEHGVITRIGMGSSRIPRDGFVVYFKNQPAMAARFIVGHRCAYRVVCQDDAGQPLATKGDWARMREAIGCGPRLLTDGRITVDPVREGFRDPKVTRESTERSLVGLTRDGWLLLVTTSGAMPQAAAVMQGLGCAQAMNLDGGASRGLWLRGHYLAAPGRELGSALLVLPK